MTDDGIRAERVYRRLLALLLPVSLRHEADADLCDVFRAAHARIAGRSALVRARFWTRMVADLLVTAVAERAQHLGLAERARRTARVNVLSQAATDLRLAARQLANAPGWTLVASGTLALGLAASVVAGVLMRDVVLAPLPIPAADRLVHVVEMSENGRRWWPSLPNARDWRDHARMFDAVGIAGTPRVEPVLLGQSAARVKVAQAGRGLFEMLGVAPVTGRLFAPDENQPTGPPVAIVTERFWRGQLRGRSLEGLAVTIGELRYDVVGVLPRDFRFLGEAAIWSESADVWTPLDREAAIGRRTSHGEYHVVARLREGVALARAREEMNELAKLLKARHGEPTQADMALLIPLQEVVVRAARGPVQLLLYAGAAVLLVSALNLASAVLAQGLSRTRELMIRRALGATRARLILHLIAGSAVLSMPATLLGITFASFGIQGVTSLAAHTWPRLDEASLDGRTVLLAFAAAVALATLAGVLPAILLSRDSHEHLRTHGGTAGRREPRLWKGLVAAQATLTVVLLGSTAFLVRSFLEAMQVDLGYDSRSVLTADVTLPTLTYGDPRRRIAFYESALARLRTIPGVASASVTSVLPHETSAYIAGTAREGESQQSVMAGYRLVDRDYLKTLSVPRLSGSEAGLADGGALIDATLHDVLWNRNMPIGDRVMNSFADAPLTVVGVVGAVREWNQGDNTIGVVYADYRRDPQRILSMHFVLRYRGDAAFVAGAVRQALAAIDPLVPVEVGSLASKAGETLQSRRFLVLLCSAFGLIALLLAASGMYALTAFVAGRRLREAAIRLALGARPATLRRLVLLQGLRPAAAGIAIGLALIVPAGRAMSAQLFQVTPSDPVAIAAAAGSVFLAALAAAVAPARRFARVDPAAALRQE